MSEEQFKICKNPSCKKKFYRRDGQPIHQWRRMVYHNRRCQQLHARDNRRPKYIQVNAAMNLDNLNDCLNRYSVKARKKMKKELTVYSSKEMTQEELQALVPSMGGGK